MKDASFAVLLLFATGILAAAAETASDAAKYEVSELRYQGWASQVLIPELAEDLGYLAPIKLKWVGNTISGPQDIQSAVTGDTDFGGAFNGSIVKLIAARAPIKAVIAYYGADQDTYTGLYVLDDNPITSASDLLGKKIGMNTLGALSGIFVDRFPDQDWVHAGRRQAGHAGGGTTNEPGSNAPTKIGGRDIPLRHCQGQGSGAGQHTLADDRFRNLRRVLARQLCID